MSYLQEAHDSLPYIDPEVTAVEREKATQLITYELPSHHRTTLHPSVPPLQEPKFSELIEKELERKAANLPMSGGIDLSRYEAPEAPTLNPESDRPTHELNNNWQSTLRKAYASSSYLSSRVSNLALLDEYGKNSWLIGNYQLEGILQQVEKELADARAATEEVNRARKSGQEHSRSEIEGLELAWRTGVGRVLEVEVAAEGLRREILERRRQQPR